MTQAEEESVKRVIAMAMGRRGRVRARFPGHPAHNGAEEREAEADADRDSGRFTRFESDDELVDAFKARLKAA